MAFDYSSLASTARGLLAEFGQDVTFTRKTEATYNNQTGAVESVSVTFADRGVIFPFAKGVTSVNGSLVQAGDQEIYWQGSTAPQPGDNVLVAGVDYKVVAVQAIEPGGVNVLYQIQVRR